LNQRLGASEKLAGTLNDQLRQEREQYRKLETSYSRSETRWSEITNRLTEEKQEAVTGLAEEKSKTLKAEHQRNSAVIVAFIFVLAWIVYVFRKLKIIPL
jgi:DNA anti-recombination protein RmuC